MYIFNELRKHAKLSAKRHPMYDKNKFAKIFGYVMGVFWAGYLIFFGTTFALQFPDMVPNREPYHVMNGIVLIIILALDFMMRFPFQKTPTQEIKPYLLLPVKRNRLIDFLLIRSGLNPFNLIWLFFFIPFAIITITKYFGILGVCTYILGICILVLINNYWYLLCRTLINERIVWVLLPCAFYGGLGCLMFIPDKSPLFDFFMDLGDGYIEGNILYFAASIFGIVALWYVNRQIMSRLIYAELNKVDDTAIKTVSEYKFFERYGEVGEYMRLEIKMLLRNKRCKSSLRSILIIIIAFSLILSFSSVYDGNFMKAFILAYNFTAFGMIILSQIMSFEGNYIDGLMSRKESIMSLLKAKYYFYAIGAIIPFILIIPAIITNKVTILGAFSWMVFTIGFIYFIFFQLAVYNKQTVGLNEKVTARQTGTAIQTIINFTGLGLPLGFYITLSKIFGETAAHIALLCIGVCFILTSPIWIKNVYIRFMKRRYKNMEGFRDSRQ